ncbi:FAD:protein FMN transferase [Polaribacter sp.]|nr:FAD:protein FMN transferase [Polaribacter sp.]
MIEIGGEIRAKGVKKKDKPWRVTGRKAGC